VRIVVAIKLAFSTSKTGAYVDMPYTPFEADTDGRHPRVMEAARPVTTDLAGRVRAICLALPEVTERPSHGAPTWFVRGKSAFVTLWAGGHHDHDFPHLWCAGPPGAQHELVAAEPARFFRPPYVGGRGWIGVRLDRGPDWAEISELCRDAYRATAPARLSALLES
jgi:hypothetical protein